MQNRDNQGTARSYMNIDKDQYVSNDPYTEVFLCKIITQNKHFFHSMYRTL